MLSVAAALMGLVGAMLRNVVAMLGIGFASYVPTSPIMYPALGSIIRDNRIAGVIANAVVTKK